MAKGDIVIKQGDEGDNFYVVDSGSFDIYQDVPAEGAAEGDASAPKVHKSLGRVGHGGSFGELALMYGCPRQATVQAAEDSVLWALDRLTFRHILVSATMNQRSKCVR